MATAIGDEQKLAELILYISQKCATDPKFGAIKLNKILYLADFLAFGNWGEPITGVEYQHLRMGPAPRRLVPVREELQRGGKLVVQPLPLKSGHRQMRVSADVSAQPLAPRCRSARTRGGARARARCRRDDTQRSEACADHDRGRAR